jgi:hypothetical protein
MAKPMLEEAEKALAKAQELGAGGQALGLRGGVTGQLAGTGGMMAGMRMGPRAFKQLDEALALAPNDPRVALMNGMTRLNAPRAFGGGPAKGEPELRRAVALFARDAATGPAPVWAASMRTSGSPSPSPSSTGRPRRAPSCRRRSRSPRDTRGSRGNCCPS